MMLVATPSASVSAVVSVVGVAVVSLRAFWIFLILLFEQERSKNLLLLLLLLMCFRLEIYTRFCTTQEPIPT